MLTMKKMLMYVIAFVGLVLIGVATWFGWPTITQKASSMWTAQPTQEAAPAEPEAPPMPTPADFGVPEGLSLIGDSVALRSEAWLRERYPEIQLDAEVSRNFYSFHEIYQAQIEANTLLSDVIVAVGANVVNDYEAQIQAVIDALPVGRRLIFVTPYFRDDPTGITTAQREYQLSLPATYNFVYIADWYQTSIDHPEIWEYTDGVHFGADYDLTVLGGQLYTETLAQALAQAAQGPVKVQ